MRIVFETGRPGDRPGDRAAGTPEPGFEPEILGGNPGDRKVRPRAAGSQFVAVGRTPPHTQHSSVCLPLSSLVVMVAGSRVLRLAAAAATAAVATCFACPARTSHSAAATAPQSSTMSADSIMITPRAVPPAAALATGGRGAPDFGNSRRSASRSLTLARAMVSTQEESVLRTRGGGGGDLGDADTGLSETDPEVWEIITAERRRQVGGVILK